MAAIIPAYVQPDFTLPELAKSPRVQVVPAPMDGVVQDNYHGTSNYPEYLHLGVGDWLLAPKSRMDSVLVFSGRQVEVVEARRVKQDDQVVVGRTENGEEGIYVNTTGFDPPASAAIDKFAFRTRGTRETPFSRSYDELYKVLRHDRDHGHIASVLGPAVAFDKDSRDAMQGLIDSGYCHSLLVGNALATHDLEAAYFRTGRGRIFIPSNSTRWGITTILISSTPCAGQGRLNRQSRNLTCKMGSSMPVKKSRCLMSWQAQFVMTGRSRK